MVLTPKTGSSIMRIFPVSRLMALPGGSHAKIAVQEQQIAFILRQAEEGMTVEEGCRKAGISAQTY